MATKTKAKNKLHRFKLPITTEKSLRTFVSAAFNIYIPNKVVCPNHSTPWRAFADAYFSKAPVVVWKASRGFGGKSFLLSLLSTVEAITQKADVNVLGGSGEQAQRILDHMIGFWKHKNAPRSYLVGEVKREQRFIFGNKVLALMASTKSVRGPHPQKLRNDEIDEEDLVILDASMGQTMTKDEIAKQTVLSSTHQYPNGTMTEVLNRADEKGWPVYEWCYRENLEPHGWLLKSEVESKKLEVTKAMWETEYEMQEPSAADRAIDTDAVERMFDKSLGSFEGKKREKVVMQAPRPGVEYVTGADWAKKKDLTEIITLKKESSKLLLLVAYEQMNRLPWPVMVRCFDDRVKRYPGSASHDATGLGDVVDGFITVEATPEILVGRYRSDLISNYIAAIERNEIRSPMIKTLYKQHKYMTIDDINKEGHLPDGVCAGMLAYNEAVNQNTAWSGRS